jgi:hypothetical protein
MGKHHWALAAALAALALTAAPAFGASYNSALYENASWYEKFTEVSSGATTLCPTNRGDAPQLSYGSNVDASHECGSQSETSIAINPASPRNVIAGSNEIQRLPMRAMVSTDGGKTFDGVDLPLPPPLTNNGFDFGSDPNVAFDAAGNAYYSYIVVFFSAGGGINGTEMALARSTDRGKTWSATYFNQQSGEGQFNDKPYVAVDTTGGAFAGRVYVAWDNASGNSSSAKNGNNLLVSHSDDGGVTVSAPVVASGNFTGATGAIGADPYVTADGTLHVAWQDYAHLTIAESSSTDGGATFTAPHVISLVGGFDLGIPAMNVRRALVYPSCGSYGSSLYCSFTNGSDAASQVYVSRSTNGGSTWSNPAAMPAGGDQFNQWLAVDPSNGSVNVAYYDTAGDATRKSTVYTLARSTDGGATYTASPIANARTDETCCAPSVNLGNQYGDYEGLAAYGGIVRPVWTDRRASVIDLGLREEVFTATLKP